MRSPDGGMRDQDSAIQIMTDVRRMVTVLGIENNLEPLLDDKFIRINYLNEPQRLKGDPKIPLRAATIRKYLLSYMTFLTFVIIDRVRITRNIDFLDVTNLKLKVFNWTKAYIGDQKEQVNFI